MTDSGSTTHGSVPRSKVHPRSGRGVVRSRLLDRLELLWARRVAVIVGPAGSGKSTLAAQFAESAQLPRRSAWYAADPADAWPETFLDGISAAVGVALGRPLRWTRVLDAVADLEQVEGQLVLVIDDFHEVVGTPSERLIEQLLEYSSPNFGLFLASRRLPSMNLSRLRVGEELVELDADDLRFRSWEVEELFRNYYRVPAPPEELAKVTRSIEGWAAGLQLYHLATQGKTAAERSRVIERLTSGSPLVRDYLTRNVLSQIGPDLRQFLLDTAVLGRLSAGLCDQFLSTTGSARRLAELETLQLFIQRLDESDFRYHEVLRSHLESMLSEAIGADQLRARYQAAGQVLEAAQAWADALRAYVLAEDEVSARRLLNQRGPVLSEDSSSWMDLVPSPLVAHDPWVQLVQARRLAQDGRPGPALAAFRAIVATASDLEPVERARREHDRLAVWFQVGFRGSDPGDWSTLVRAGLRGDPGGARSACLQVGRERARFGAGMAAALDGDRLNTISLLDAAEAGEPLSPSELAMSGLVRAVMDVIAVGAEPSAGVGVARTHADARSLNWVGTLANVVNLVRADALADDIAPRLAEGAHQHGDFWIEALVPFAVGLREWRRVHLGERPDESSIRYALESLEYAATLFGEADATVLAAWAMSLRAALEAVATLPLDELAGREALAMAWRSGSRGAVALAQWANSLLPSHSAAERLEFARLAEEAAIRMGWRYPAVAAAGDAAFAAALPAKTSAGAAANGSGPGHEFAADAPDRFGTVLRCFGGFELRMRGAPVDIGVLKPRVQSVLRLLSSRAGEWVHREELIVALWPDADSSTGNRNLQVALSAVRQLLEPGSERRSALLPRQGESYALMLPGPSVVDHRRLVELATQARRLLSDGRGADAEAAMTEALGWYRGELLPLDSGVDWVLKDREHYRLEAAELAHRLASIRVDSGRLGEGAEAAERGLRIDRYHDGLWQALIRAHDLGDNRAATEQARRRYGEVLRELGIDE